MPHAIQQIDTDRVEPQVRTVYRRAGYLAIVGNVLLLVAKVWLANLSGSSAIYADAANSAADVAYSALMLVGLWLATKPADANHPHGHRRVEPLVSLAIGVGMGFAATEAARAGIMDLRQPEAHMLPPLALLAPIGTALIKTGMFYVTRRMGRSIRSGALLAAAQDNLSDLLASLLVLVAVAANRLGVGLADPIAALLVALFIYRGAWEVLRESFMQLTGGAPSAELNEAVIEAVLKTPCVLDADRVVIDHVGPLVRADIHIKMHGSTTLSQTHYVSHLVREAVEALPGVDHAFVHVEPVEGAEWDPSGIARADADSPIIP